MQRLVKIIAVIAILKISFFTPGVVFAQVYDKIFSLREAIDMALTNNSLINEAIEKQRAAIQEKKVANREFLPKASASYSYTKLKDNPYAVFGLSKIVVGPEDNYHWNVSLMQPLFTGFALLTKQKIANLGLEIKGLEKKQALLDVIKETKVAYFNILLTKKFLMVANEAVSQLDSHREDAEKFYKQGMIPYNDLLKTEVALANALQNRVKAESNVEMAVSSLNTIIGVDINKKSDIVDALNIEPSEHDLGNLFDKAKKNRPELKMLYLALKNSDNVIRLAKSAYYPQIALVARYEQSGDNPEATNNDYANVHNTSITLQAKWTFFEWGKKRAEVKKYYYNKLSMIEKVKGVEDSIMLEVKNAFLNIKVAKKNIQTAKESLVQAKENYRITNLQYQQQMTTSTEVLDARTFLTQAETNYYSALYGYMVSMAELDRAIGKRGFES
ncbi:MAG: TolC family protein [Thermodesulfobacteriota bacterium]|nr:TolC family protein [Thermodesulfobacteriota bacterium]